MNRPELPENLRDLSLADTILCINPRLDRGYTESQFNPSYLEPLEQACTSNTSWSGSAYLEEAYDDEFTLSYLEPLDWPYLADINLKVLKKLIIASLVSPMVLVGLEESYPARYRSFVDLIGGSYRRNKDNIQDSGMNSLIDPFVVCEVLAYVPLADLFDIVSSNTECGVAALTASYDNLVESLPLDINDLDIGDLAPLLYWNSGFDKRYEFVDLLKRLYRNSTMNVYDKEIASILLKYNILPADYYSNLLMGGIVL